MAGRGSKRDNPGISKNKTDHPKRTHFMAGTIHPKMSKGGSDQPKKGKHFVAAGVQFIQKWVETW